MTYLEKLARAFNPLAADALTYESQLRFLDNLEQTNPEKFQKIIGNNPALREGLDSWRQINNRMTPGAVPGANPAPNVPPSNPAPQPRTAPPPQQAAPPPPQPPPPTPPPTNNAAAPTPPPPENVPPTPSTGRKVMKNFGGGLGAFFAPLTAGMATKNVVDGDYAQAGLNTAWTGEAALGATRAFAPHLLPAALSAPAAGTAVSGALGGAASLGAGLAGAPIVGSWMYDTAQGLDALRKGSPEEYLQSSDDYMGDNNWKTIPKSVAFPLTAGAALINRGKQVIEQNAANEAQADVNAMQESRLNRLQEMDQEFARKGGFKSPDEMYANMYGYNDVNAYQQALRSGEFQPEKTMGEARAMLQRGVVRPVYGALTPQNTAPVVADVGSPQPATTPAVVPAPKPVVPPSKPSSNGAVGMTQPKPKASTGSPYVPDVGQPPLPSSTPVATAGLPKVAPVAPAQPVQAKAVAQAPAAQPQIDPAVNQQQWEKRFLTETGTPYNPVSRADRASMQRMMGGNQPYNMKQWRSAGRPDAQPDFSIAYSEKPLTPNVQVAKKTKQPAVKVGELARRNTGVTTADGEIWTNPADKDYLTKDARYSGLTWEEYQNLPPSEKAQSINTFFNTVEKSI